ncbi:hypothetical protein [Deinococcus radiophilus]|nr:hypothetical protein [Deinococcus radiophilus]
MSAEQVTKSFRGVRLDRIEELLEMLLDMGQARQTEDLRRYTA